MATDLFSKRMTIACAHQRPSICKGCPCDPSTPGHNPLLTGGHVPPSGPRDAPLIALGISGGEEEERRGEPLVGPSGRKLQRSLAWAGLPTLGGAGVRGSSAPQLNARYLNVLNCRSLKVGLQGRIINRTPPTMREMRACAERWLFPELRKTAAKVILILGTDAHNFLMGDRFGPFGKAMGHRLLVPRNAVESDSLGRVIYSYGVEYKV